MGCAGGVVASLEKEGAVGIHLDSATSQGFFWEVLAHAKDLPAPSAQIVTQAIQIVALLPVIKDRLLRKGVPSRYTISVYLPRL
jgi:hypothetical protein